MDLAVSFYERDREQFAVVLGSAVALRLFLFLVPSTITMVGLIGVIAPRVGLADLLEQASVTGSVAEEVARATDASRPAWAAVVAGGLVLTAWAGRNLAVVLAACSGAAWGLGFRQSRATVRIAATVTVLAVGIVVTIGVVNRMRASFGLAGETTSWFLATLVLGLAWFAVSSVLPRGTTDPGALLPGAALVGTVLAATQWFLQYYLPGRIERASAVAGGTGVTVAVLGAMFVVGRAMAASFILDAVVHERLGSVSRAVFALPLLRTLPRRSPWLARYFDLPDAPAAPDALGATAADRDDHGSGHGGHGGHGGDRRSDGGPT